MSPTVTQERAAARARARAEWLEAADKAVQTHLRHCVLCADRPCEIARVLIDARPPRASAPGEGV